LHQETKGTVGQISKLISVEWKRKTPEERQAYQRHSDKLRKQYQENMEAYKRTSQYQNYQRTLQNWKEEQKDMKRLTRKTLKSVLKPLRTAAMPKRPPTSYFVFIKERRSAVRALNPSLNGTEVGKLLAQEWRNKPETTKQFYKNQAEAMKAVWTAQMAAYKRTDEYKQYREELQQ